MNFSTIDLEIAKCNGNRDELMKIKDKIYSKMRFPGSLFTSSEKKSEIYYLLSVIYKELGEYKKFITTLKKSYILNKDSKFLLASLISAYNLYSEDKKYYSYLVKLFKSKIDNISFEYSGNSASDVKKIIKDNGFIVIKNFFDKEVIKKLEKNFLNNIEISRKTLQNLNKYPDNCIYPIYMISDYGDEKKLKEKVNLGFSKEDWALDKYIDESDRSFINNNITNNLKNSFINELLIDYTNNDKWKMYFDYSMSRKISQYGLNKDGFAGFHQDSRIQLFYKRYLTFWIPFCKVGKNSAPSLTVLPTYCKRFIPYEYSLNANNILEQRLSTEDFPKDCLIQPSLEIGDIWIHDSFTMHGTYIDEYSVGDRLSIDCRFF